MSLFGIDEPAEPNRFLRAGALDRDDQQGLAEAVAEVMRAAPPFTPRMPRTGKPFSVRMTNCGPLGWVSDIDGYRYQDHHPETGAPWPPMPAPIAALWERFADYPAPAEACLINVYAADARMGLHRDEDEKDFGAPVVSVSLGDECRFRIGGPTRKGPTRSFRLRSGDVVVLAGDDRLAYHGVDRIYLGTGPVGLDLPAGARVNLTLRRVSAAS